MLIQGRGLGRASYFRSLQEAAVENHEILMFEILLLLTFLCFALMVVLIIYLKIKAANRPSNSKSQLIHETAKGSHEFEIKGYSLAKGLGVGKSMTSGKFTVGGYNWVIIFFPGGYDETNKEYISVYLKLVTSNDRDVRALVEFKLMDQSGIGNHIIDYGTGDKSPTTYTRRWMWGHRRYMKRSDLETSNYLIKGDCLRIHCAVGVVQTRVEEGKRILVPPSDMCKNLKGLVESEIGYDITFKVGNEFFRAHKLILAARSPVFRAQFFGLVGDPNMKTIDIEDFDPFAFKAMLLFLYSDELPETCELFDSDTLCTSTTLMQHLLVAADRFDLARLKLMCEARLCEEITAKTVATTLVIAELHQCLQLKTICLNFATKPGNLGEVMKSDGYAYLEKLCPSLLKDSVKSSSVVDKK